MVQINCLSSPLLHDCQRIIVNQSLLVSNYKLSSVSQSLSFIFVGAGFVISVPVVLFLFIIVRLMPEFSSLQGQYHAFSTFHPALATVDNMLIAGRAAAE